MKWILRIGIGLAVLLVAAFLVLFALSHRPNAGTITSAVTIERPRAEVWTWITNPDRIKQWVGGLVEIKNAQPGPPEVGMSEIWVINDPNMKEAIEVRGTLTAVEPEEHLAVRIEMPGGFSGEQHYRLAAKGASTELTISGRYTYGPWFAALMEPLITPQGKQKLAADLATLKRLAESVPVVTDSVVDG